MSNKNFKNQNYRNHRNYGQYSKQNEENELTVVTENVDVEEAAVENTEVEEETIDNTNDKSTVPVGVVNCSRLNIRKRPDIDSDPLCVVDNGCELNIDQNYQNEDWLKIITPDNVSGYCMLKFVDLK